MGERGVEKGRRRQTFLTTRRGREFSCLRTKKSRKSSTLEFARKKQWVRKEKARGLSVNERTSPTLCAEGTR